jgi:hypothetical protein
MVFSGMLLLLHTRLMHDSHLLWACYLILLLCTTFCAVALPIEPAATTKRHVAAEGVWQVSFRKHSSALSISRGRVARTSEQVQRGLASITSRLPRGNETHLYAYFGAEFHNAPLSLTPGAAIKIIAPCSALATSHSSASRDKKIQFSNPSNLSFYSFFFFSFEFSTLIK